jgi:hypothetical protein
MALTKPRAYQIYDIDYKQATRVITVANVTLSGGAPSQVDGVNLSLNDRVLVTGQTNRAQNGIYEVSTVGSGANGTWVRSGDTNTTGELLAGTIVMVTEGLIYADTQWKLTTNDPITIGVSELVFEQNSAFAFGNVNANGTAVLANSVGSTINFTAGNNISITGNNTSKTVTIGVTGISLNSISNGTSNVNVVSSGGNVTVGVNGTSNVAVFSSSGLAVTGNITGNGAGLSGINAFSTVAVTGGNSAVADSIADTLTLTAGTGISIVMDSSTDTLTIAASGGSEIFVDGADFGTVTEAVTLSDDLGLVTAAVEAESDLGSIVTSGVFFPDLLVVNDPTDFQLGGGSNGQYLGTYGNGTIFWQSLSSAPLAGNMVGNINGNTFSITGLSVVTASSNITGGNLISSGNVTGGNIILTGNLVDSGALTIITGSDGNIALTPNGTGIVTVSSALTVTGNVTGGNLSAGTGTITGGNIVNSNANGVGNIGSATTYFNTVFAKATSAQYADLAEMYVADSSYEPGTVVVFGGDKEVTISAVNGDTRVAGVVSTNPSYIMNSGLEAEYVATVALAGRVPTKVFGPVAKGDLMISATGGYARACNQPTIGTVIGKSLENLDQSTGIVEIVIGVR